MRVSVLQWNIYYAEDIHHIAAFLRKHPADFVCLQELTKGASYQSEPDTVAYIAQQLGYHYHHLELPIETTDGRREILANAVFSRLPVVARHHAYTNEPTAGGGYSDEYRGYVELTATLPDGSPLTVATTHMSYTHAFEPTARKAEETAYLLRQLKRHPQRLVLTGDLNALPGSPTLATLEGLLRNAGPDLHEPTWTTKPFSYNGFQETQLRWRLDHVLATPDLTVADARIISTDYSDHLPIWVTFELPERTPHEPARA